MERHPRRSAPTHPIRTRWNTAQHDGQPNYLGTSIFTYIDDIVVVDWIRTTGRAAYGRVVMTVDMIRATGRMAPGGIIGNIDISDTYYSADDEHYLD